VTTSEATVELKFGDKKTALHWAKSLHLAKGACEFCIGHANGSYAPVRRAVSASSGGGKGVNGGSNYSVEPGDQSRRGTAASIDLDRSSFVEYAGSGEETAYKNVDDNEMNDSEMIENNEMPNTLSQEYPSSFDPQHRIFSAALPCVDGEAYYPTLHTAILNAKHEIFITDWWLHPYTFLKRPAKVYPNSRLDRMLEKKAKQGIKIYILLWKEIELAVPHASYWTTQYLSSLHSNIITMRHPNHFGSRGIRYWSHHEKIVVIDQHVAFIGGLDLTYGRYDTFNHDLFDYAHDESLLNTRKIHQEGLGSGMETMNSIKGQHAHPQTYNDGHNDKVENSTSRCHNDTGYHGGGTFPGRDYNNARVQAFEDISRWDDQIDRANVPRMPWHDVHVMLVGEPARDVGRHFIHRWNFSKIDKGAEDLPPIVPTCPTPWEYQDACLSASSSASASEEDETEDETEDEEEEEEVEHWTSVNGKSSLNVPFSASSPPPLITTTTAASVSLKNSIRLPSVLRCPRMPRTKERTVGNAKETKANHFDTGIKITGAKKNTIEETPRSSVLSEVHTYDIALDVIVEEKKKEKEKKDTGGVKIQKCEEKDHQHIETFRNDDNDDEAFDAFDALETPVDVYDFMHIGIVDEDHPTTEPKKTNDDTPIHKIMKHDTKMRKLSSMHALMQHHQHHHDKNSSGVGTIDGPNQGTPASPTSTASSTTTTVTTNGKSNQQRNMYRELYREIYCENVMYHGVKLMQCINASSLSIQKNNVVSTLPAAIGVECQVVRSLGEWSGGVHENSIHTSYRRLIRRSKKYILIENQFFISGMDGDQRVKNRIIEEIYTRIVRAHAEQPGQFKVYIFMPLAPSEDSDIDKSPVIRACMHWQFQTLSRGKSSLFSMLIDRGINPNEYVGVFALRTHDITPSTKVPVSEMVYIHSKVMVVDDLWSIIGSANINDRSMVGHRDSEIAVVMHDTAEFIHLKMGDGQYEKVGKLGYETRTRLLQEHVGILPNELHFYNDLSSDAVFNKIKNIATRNTFIYTKIFGCVPNNDVHSFVELKKYRATLARQKKTNEENIGGMVEEEKEDEKGKGKRKKQSQPREEEAGNNAVQIKTESSSTIKPSEASLHQHSHLSLRSMSSSEISETKSSSNELLSEDESSKVRNNTRHTVPDCYAEPPEPHDEVVLLMLNQVRGHIVLYPLDFLKDETADGLLPHFFEKEFLVQSHFFT